MFESFRYYVDGKIKSSSAQREARLVVWLEAGKVSLMPGKAFKECVQGNIKKLS